jgi:hypothetical protein
VCGRCVDGVTNAIFFRNQYHIIAAFDSQEFFKNIDKLKYMDLMYRSKQQDLSKYDACPPSRPRSDYSVLLVMQQYWDTPLVNGCEGEFLPTSLTQSGMHPSEKEEEKKINLCCFCNCLSG